MLTASAILLKGMKIVWLCSEIERGAASTDAKKPQSTSMASTSLPLPIGAPQVLHVEMALASVELGTINKLAAKIQSSAPTFADCGSPWGSGTEIRVKRRYWRRSVSAVSGRAFFELVRSMKLALLMLHTFGCLRIPPLFAGWSVGMGTAIP